MTYVKRLVINGFKSFANKTEIPFDNGINVIIGANGSGKSNISDALCFVLGRMGSKTLRAQNSSGFIFTGTSAKKPASEAIVEIVFDNREKSFSVNDDELSIKRIVRKNGTSIYKINNDIKTRQDVVEILAQSGIDPNGFNLVLQGGIQNLVKMPPSERREIIEEVAGISIYESRKQKSLQEIEKTEQKLKEVGGILRERTAYLRNLEEERKQALRFKELEKTIKQCKATIIKKNIDEKQKEIDIVEKEVSKNNSYKEKVKSEINLLNDEIRKFEDRITEINKHIQETTGFQRENLNEEITDLKSKIARDSARVENFENKLSENELRKEKLEQEIEEIEKEIIELKKKSPIISKRQEELRIKKKELEKLTEDKERLFRLNNELRSTKERIYDREKTSQKFNAESKLIFSQINSLSQNLASHTISDCEKEIKKLTDNLNQFYSKANSLKEDKFEVEKQIVIEKSEIERNLRHKKNMPNENTCPLCLTKLTKEHIEEVLSEADKSIFESEKKITNFNLKISKIEEEIIKIQLEISQVKEKISLSNVEMMKLTQIEDKKSQMNSLMQSEKEINKEITDLKNRLSRIDGDIKKVDSVEEKYNKLLFDIQEISSRTDENLDTSILFKEKELEGLKNIIKNIIKDKKEIEFEVSRLSKDLSEDKKNLGVKEKALDLLNKKFKSLFEEKNNTQDKIRQKNILLINKQNALTRFEEVVHELKISMAKVSASKESFEYELKDFEGVEFIQGNIQFLRERLEKSERTLSSIGSVNMRALETYDELKEEYDKISQKVEQLEKERDDILKIIQEIDVKKRKTFLKTFTAINELFTANFSELSSKGKAFLELENEKDIFEGGVNITIKLAKGKYFDVTSLSGGEQTLISLSLIFAIQEYNPYCFYIFDEVDAALDKKNSELLANLFKKYMKKGQYIIITHNDSIITSATNLYGISMNHGISKIISLKLNN